MAGLLIYVHSSLAITLPGYSTYWLFPPLHYHGTNRYPLQSGYQTIVSSPWYLNYLHNPYGWGYIEDYYKADPQNFNGTAQQKKLVIGGEGKTAVT